MLIINELFQCVTMWCFGGSFFRFPRLQGADFQGGNDLTRLLAFQQRHHGVWDLRDLPRASLDGPEVSQGFLAGKGKLGCLEFFFLKADPARRPRRR
ncbi:hypothetical protein A7Q09_08160 [Methylacidiphilum sp. Yel]|nr:hypothetical protein A7Q09_08160 [Methylacidiphilum sp. Yel]